MKNFLIILIILIFSTGKMIAQSPWEKIELPDSISPRCKLYCLDENKLFLFQTNRCPGTIYQTKDGGKNWEIMVGSGSKIDSTKSDGDFISTPMSFINKNIVFFNVFITTDKGETWSFVSSLFRNEMLYELGGLHVFDSNKAFVAGSRNLIKSEDGFQSQNRSYCTTDSLFYPWQWGLYNDGQQVLPYNKFDLSSNPFKNFFYKFCRTYLIFLFTLQH